MHDGRRIGPKLSSYASPGTTGSYRAVCYLTRSGLRAVIEPSVPMHTAPLAEPGSA